MEEGGDDDISKMGGQNITPPLFHFMLFTSWTHEHFTEIYCNIAEGTSYFIISTVSIFVDIFLSTWNKNISSNLEQEHFFQLGTRTFLPTWNKNISSNLEQEHFFQLGTRTFLPTWNK